MCFLRADYSSECFQHVKRPLSNSATLAPKVCYTYNVTVHVCLAHVHTDHNESIVCLALDCGTFTYKYVGQISPSTLIRLPYAQLKKVCVFSGSELL